MKAGRGNTFFYDDGTRINIQQQMANSMNLSPWISTFSLAANLVRDGHTASRDFNDLSSATYGSVCLLSRNRKSIYLRSKITPSATNKIECDAMFVHD
jgi:hypothetical protein